MKKDRMKGVDSADAGIVEMLYNLLFYGVVGNSVCRTWESCTLAFPCAVNRVIHDAIASYAHFHDAEAAMLNLLISTSCTSYVYLWGGYIHLEIFFTTKQGLFTTCHIRTKHFLRYNIKKCCFLSYSMDYKKST